MTRIILFLTLACLVAWLLDRLIRVYDSTFMLVEYGKKGRCPSCGREALMVRRRADPGDPWSGWTFECCHVAADGSVDGAS